MPKGNKQVNILIYSEITSLIRYNLLNYSICLHLNNLKALKQNYYIAYNLIFRIAIRISIKIKQFISNKISKTLRGLELGSLTARDPTLTPTPLLL